MPQRTLVQGLCLPLPDAFHSLVVHVQYSRGHKPENPTDSSKKRAIPAATVKLKGDVRPHAGPCWGRGCVVGEMAHRIPALCPVCEMAALVAEGVYARF